MQVSAAMELLVRLSDQNKHTVVFVSSAAMLLGKYCKSRHTQSLTVILYLLYPICLMYDSNENGI